VTATSANVYIRSANGTSPTVAASGSYNDIWLKSTSAGQGAKIVVKNYSTSTGAWSSVTANVYSRDDAATAVEGSSLATNDVYVRFDDFDDETISNELKANFTATATTLSSEDYSKQDILTFSGATSTPEVMYKLRIRGSGVDTVATGSSASLNSGVATGGSNTAINFEVVGQSITVTGAAGAGNPVTLDEIVTAINNNATVAGANIVASKDYVSASRQYLKLTRAGGYAVYIHDGTDASNVKGVSTADLGFTDNVSSGSTFFTYKSLWNYATY
jgi:hypothetical protein